MSLGIEIEILTRKQQNLSELPELNPENLRSPELSQLNCIGELIDFLDNDKEYTEHIEQIFILKSLSWIILALVHRFDCSKN